MNLINRMRSYLLEEEFAVNILKNKVNIINYINIDHFDINKVVIRHSEGFLKIMGKNLVVSKLLGDEVLITGDIQNIELG
ncbi:MAG: YabP/YqfC family sporulation protein [Bacilli bacterium]|nr:YabP/YqfC family sporulation protein [Bacilli bacterium]MDD4282613.1 YabP/YqfC family sporulation protein [Bacilli bacterium]MDD4718517.1 YabP/YqfC family sporulation protein [Bacilli bacterium]